MTVLKETNTLEELKRPPDDTRRYLAWKNDIKERYGSINDFVVAERLHWPLDEANSANGPAFVHKSKIPFEERSDYAVLVNDWPYGFEEGIKHVCVWSKTPIATDDERGDITPESRKLIEAFIERHFARDLGEGGSERVQWFKNWVSLQSVKGVDHVHVLIRNAPPELLDGWLERKDL